MSQISKLSSASSAAPIKLPSHPRCLWDNPCSSHTDQNEDNRCSQSPSTRLMRYFTNRHFITTINMDSVKYILGNIAPKTVSRFQTEYVMLMMFHIEVPYRSSIWKFCVELPHRSSNGILIQTFDTEHRSGTSIITDV